MDLGSFSLGFVAGVAGVTVAGRAWRARRRRRQQQLSLPALIPCPGLDGRCTLARGHLAPCWDGMPDAGRLRRL